MSSVVNLTTEYKTNPIGLDEPKPRFSWQITSSGPILQGAYRLQVFREEDDAPLWDTGRVNRRDSVLVPYDGPALEPRTRYAWRVRIWDKRGREVEWSETAYFETGLMGRPFEAKFISAPQDEDISKMQSAPRLRREFTLPDKPIKRARVYATALGIYALRLNGKPVSPDLLSPGWTSYHNRLQYQTYDVTALMQAGKNAVACSLADGWYRGYLAYKDQRNFYGTQLGLLCQIVVTYEDGTEETLLSDGSWKALQHTPVLYADIYNGTHYDARLETPGWDQPGFDDGGWSDALLTTDVNVHIVAQLDHPVRRQMAITPVALITTPKGETVLDMGQNMVGWLKFTVRGEAGRTVTVSHAEVLDKDGNFYTENYRNAQALLKYTLKGEGEETYEPEQTFYGFRYVRLENWPGEIRLKDFAGVVIHSDIQVTSGFECSDERVNQLFHNIQWGQRGNFVDVPTDCPQRDERLGWTGDCQIFARTACINMDSALMLSEWLKDLAADQREDGGVPFVVPQVLNKDAYGSAAWGDAATIVPWTLYKCYADQRVLERQYPSMRKWIDFITAHSDDDLWTQGFHFGDWLGLDAHEGSYVGATDRTLIATAFYAYSVRECRRAAEVLGYEKDAMDLRNLYRRIVKAYRQEFITPNGRLAVHTQTAYVLTLFFDLCEEADRPRLVRELCELIEQNGGHLTTGFVGTPYLCKALTEGGAHDVAGHLFMKADYPSWLYGVTKGATTMWEHWDGIKPDGTFWSKDMNSYNHYAYGAIGEWMMRCLAGIDMSKPGYRELVIHPRPIEELSFVSAWQMTPYGRVRSEWRDEDGTRHVNVSIPGGTTAVLILENTDVRQVCANGKILSEEITGVFRAWQSENDAMIELDSGSYAFSWQYDNVNR
ncbi:MAG: family 78 glycoside hydrolase catalytic domain [Clostridia bacterium]|nr:family 78 glycoside hydrolase catalytic domain [Clostridia bacterium]